MDSNRVANGAGARKGRGKKARKRERRRQQAVDASVAPDAAGSPVSTAEADPLVGAPRQSLPACPMCGAVERTIVCEYNRLVVLDQGSPTGSGRYDYVLCHRCGLVYASERPDADQLGELWDGFEDAVGREPDPDRPMRTLRIHPLDSSTREELRRRLDSGIHVSIESEPAESDWLVGLQVDREAGAPHLDLLLSLLPDDRPRRALEIRPRTGYLLDALRRLRGAEVRALPMYDSEQFIAREAFGIQADFLLDETAFAIPYEEEFDLIIAKHQLTHALAPDEVFAAFRERLAPGGHIYLHTELDDSTQVDSRTGIFAFMVPFHLQAFDPPTLGRTLRHQGFEPSFITRVGPHLACLATFSPGVEAEPLPASILEKRQSYYERWRDLSIVKLSAKLGDDRLRELFGDELDEVHDRAVKGGLAEVRGGRVRLAKSRSGDSAAPGEDAR